ncbi:MAG: UDP-3-O-[3-hydroxymyristoyl] N-acetylglucosamine deacetylase [Deltaproteobacteria bacterium]|nr:UDP-3-O-[3-hydroxymyristoyl] N-acetylglucosamine deacetylase [Deltaproteobacteria bacterium]MBK9369147.1 UDP-3-O-[3-hydroxymyristoyl] N-acetylglucosamine deacetylase [Deltaproteobacteria bacterium]MBK9644227.1 UDP-3-O-[3-hydroxymyristoyl] N-acetylglucosamine deacetylase [Deltaproteobacteria bacterium]
MRLNPPQQTLNAPVVAEGVGLHTGVWCKARALPAPAHHGVRFVRVDLPGAPELPAAVSHVRSTVLATTLGEGEASVSTVEHLLATLYALGVDNARIEVEGPELPVLDGSAGVWTERVLAAGVVPQDAEVAVLRLTRPLSLSDGDRQVILRPCEDGLRLQVTVNFDHPTIGEQRVQLAVSPESFLAELAWARTFGFLEEVERIRAAGLARGGSLENAVVFCRERGVLNPEGLRAADEPVRHKALDLLGDLSLLGARLYAEVEVRRPGHGMTLQAVRALLNEAATRS